MPMTPQEVDAFLAEPRLCAFATVGPDGRPRVRPLWFLWRDRAFWLTTRRDVRRTGRDLRTHPWAALSVASDQRPYRAVIAQGCPEVLDPDEQLLLAISTRYGEREGRRWTARALREPDRVVLRLVPEVLLSWDYRRESTDRGSKRTVI
jgi:PPOX class probable F420-dependent enzyme